VQCVPSCQLSLAVTQHAVLSLRVLHCCYVSCRSSAEATAALPSAAEAAARVAAMQAEKQLLQQQLQEVRCTAVSPCFAYRCISRPQSVPCTYTASAAETACNLTVLQQCGCVTLYSAVKARNMHT
jgi:hypothetical protein